MYIKKELNPIYLDSRQIYSIIKRFHSKFKLRLRRNSEYLNPNSLPSNIEDISFIHSYKYICVYSDKLNQQKECIVVKYTLKNMDEIICLNLPLHEYEDIIK